MGYLSEIGATYNYEESKEHIEYVKKQGIIQLVKNLKKNIGSQFAKEKDQFLWGDEIEFHLVKKGADGKFKLQINTEKIFQKVNSDYPFIVQPEYGAWMLEVVPKDVFNQQTTLNEILSSLKARKEKLSQILGEDEYQLHVPSYPFLGVGDFYHQREETNHPVDYMSDNEEEYKELEHNTKCKVEERIVEKTKKNIFSRSWFSSDEIINPHPRFATLTRNIRQRRQEKVCIQVPLFLDTFTNPGVTTEEPFQKHIYMDAMSFGMGACCLQVTYSTYDFNQARHLYDQFAVISPLMLAITAGSPIFKGKMANIDTRWRVISQSVDDRTKEERDKNSPNYLPKSRYDSISYFMGGSKYFRSEYNDLDFRVNEDMMKYAEEEATKAGVQLDQDFLRHIGFLYTRDPLVIYKDKVETSENSPSTAHFENVQSTNWNSVRFKPPPSLDSNIGWRVEFRTMEIQATEQENAAFLFFIKLLRSMLACEKLGLNFYMPMSLVDENFAASEKKDAILKQKFWFRKNYFDNQEAEKGEYIKLTISEILGGKPSENFVGLVDVMTLYVKELEEDYIKNGQKEVYNQLSKDYLQVSGFLIDKASGKLLTLAKYIRRFVEYHPLYGHDSIIQEPVATDLLNNLVKLTNFGEDASLLIGNYFNQ